MASHQPPGADGRGLAAELAAERALPRSLVLPEPLARALHEAALAAPEGAEGAIAELASKILGVASRADLLVKERIPPEAAAALVALYATCARLGPVRPEWAS